MAQIMIDTNGLANCHTDSYSECNTNCHSNGYRDAKAWRITKVAARTAASRSSTTETSTLPVGAV
jgi:predicted CxxxxCH...CXXCH cytochrome family protein